MKWSLIALLLLATVSGAARAHDSGSLSLQLTIDGGRPSVLTVEADAADLALAVPLDGDGDGAFTWREYAASQPLVFDYLRESLTLSTLQGPCSLTPAQRRSGIRSGDAPSLLSGFRVDCPAGAEWLRLDNRLLADFPSPPLVLFRVSGADDPQTRVLDTGPNDIELASADTGAGLISFFATGVHHIVTGFDHLAFLLLLLIPLVRRDAAQSAWRPVLVVVTAFTLAHSVTLGLAATGLIALPPGPVEIAIAASVVLVGVLNLLRPRHRHGWLLAYCFGLVHGFGFAGLLRELARQQPPELLDLAAFNLGVEMGQLACVALAMPVLVWVGRQRQYWRYALPGLSLSVSGLGGLWILQRL